MKTGIKLDRGESVRHRLSRRLNTKRSEVLTLKNLSGSAAALPFPDRDARCLFAEAPFSASTLRPCAMAAFPFLRKGDKFAREQTRPSPKHARGPSTQSSTTLEDQSQCLCACALAPAPPRPNHQERPGFALDPALGAPSETRLNSSHFACNQDFFYLLFHSSRIIPHPSKQGSGAASRVARWKRA